MSRLATGPLTDRPGRLALQRLSYTCFLIFCLCAQWSGILLDSLAPSDGLLLASLVFSLLARGGRLASDRSSNPLSKPIMIFLVAIATSMIASEIFQPSAHYLDGRITLETVGQSTDSGVQAGQLASVLLWVKLFVATAGVAWLLRLHCHPRERRSQQIAFATVLGSTLSATVAILEAVNVLDLRTVLAHPVGGPRASGLAFHPNSLALYLVAALPLCTVLWRNNRALMKIFAACSGILILAGIFVADSRISLICAILLLCVMPVVSNSTGRTWFWGLASLLILSPAIWWGSQQLLENTRLSGGESSQASDVGRFQLVRQALTDFLNYPLQGIGFSASGLPPFLPLAVLACGGIIAFGGWLAFWFSIARSCHWGTASGDARAYALSAGAIFVVTLGQNNFVDRQEYLFAMLAGLYASLSRMPTPAFAKSFAAHPQSGSKSGLNPPVSSNNRAT